MRTSTRAPALLLLLLNCVCGLLYACQEEGQQTFDPERRYAVEQLKEDFLLFRTALEEGHGGLHYYSSKAETDKLFDAIMDSLDHPMTEAQFYRLVALMIAEINDGHTGAMFSSEYDAYLSREPILLPFNLLFIDTKAYLFRNYGPDRDFVLGGEVIAINDRAMSEIVGAMLPYIPSDGHILASKYKRLSSTSYFGRLYSLLFGKTTSFKIAYKSQQDGKQNVVRVKGITADEMNRMFQQRYPDAAKSRPPMELEFRQNIALMTIRTFSDEPHNQAGRPFSKRLKEMFTELSEKEIKHLIIDLRDNGGGADVNGKLLFSYLIDRPFLFYTRLELRIDDFSFLKHTDSPDLGTMITFRTKRNEIGTYDFLMHPNLGEQQPSTPTFAGKVYVLINGGSFSGSGETTSMMHYHKRAVFIGEECGAGYYGNTSGIMPTLTLPHTKIRVRIPLIRYVMAVSDYKYPDRGIIPDYPVHRTIEDYLGGKDAEVEFAFELIRKQD